MLDIILLFFTVTSWFNQFKRRVEEYGTLSLYVVLTGDEWFLTEDKSERNT